MLTNNTLLRPLHVFIKVKTLIGILFGVGTGRDIIITVDYLILCGLFYV